MLLYILLFLQLVDLLTTHYALTSGKGTEANPLLLKLFNEFGHLPVLLVLKGLYCVALVYLVPMIEFTQYAWTLWVMAGFYVYIAINNISVILKHKD